MTQGPDHRFDEDYWEQHWHGERTGGPGSMGQHPPNPYLAGELSDLAPGTALDAGCGAGAEAIWLATHGWQVTAVDISTAALARAADRAATNGEAADRVQWLQADLTVWEPGTRFDLVMTHYAHPAMSQLDFYQRIADWVAPGGTLLLVGHLHTARTTGDDHSRDGRHGHSGDPLAEASVTAAAITARLADSAWVVDTAEEQHRSLDGHEVLLHDVVVRATRRT